MSKQALRGALPIAVVSLSMTMAAARPWQPAANRSVVSAPDPAGVSESVTVDGCHILVLWHTYRGGIDYNASQVRVKGSPVWSNIRGPSGPLAISLPPPETRTNGRIYNWKEELRQECDRNRRYRFRVVAPEYTGEPVRSNEPYAGAERWLYYPSSSSRDWTKTTSIDLGYLDWCVIDGSRCSRPNYPSGPTPVLKW